VREWLVGFLVLLTFSCTENGFGGHGPDDLLRINTGETPVTFDWNVDRVGHLIIDAYTEGLVNYGDQNGSLILSPGLAKEWESNSKATEWTFILRSNVKWSDEVVLTPQHVVDSFERVFTPATGSKEAQNFFVIKNSQKYYQGKIKDFSEVGVKVIGDNRVQFTLEEPASYFPHLLTSSIVTPIRRDLIKKWGKSWSDWKNLVVLGPYLVTEVVHDEYVLLKKNPHYYGAPPVFSRVKVLSVDSAHTGVQLFDAGQIDFQVGLPSQNLPFLKEKPAYLQQKNYAVGYLGFDVRKEPVKEKKLRQAIAMAIDPQEVVKVLGGGKVAISDWMPVGLEWERKKQKSLFDIQKAKQLFEQTNYKRRGTKKRIKLTLHNYKNHQIMCENIQYQLKKNLGLEIELEVMEWKMFLQQLRSNPPTMHRLGQTPSFIEPVAMLMMLGFERGQVVTGWNNAEYESLLTQALGETNLKKQRSLIAKGLNIIREEVPVIPIYAGTDVNLVSLRIARPLPHRDSSNFFALLKLK
jgi:oligopeptide transport system substrate-binding protein